MFRTRTKKRIDELNRRVEESDFTRPEKRDPKFESSDLELKYKLELAKQAYHEASFRNELENRSSLRKFGGALEEFSNIMRAAKTSMDFSALGRQGGLLVLGDPRLAPNAVKAGIKAGRSKEGAFEVSESIKERPNYKLYKESGLFIPERGYKLSDMEEVYMSRNANKIPGLRASQDSYEGTLKVLRADKFDQLLSYIERPDRPVTPAELKLLANFVNKFTGRGDFGGIRSLENMAAGLNHIFFAPRWVMSRFQVLTGQPLWTKTSKPGEPWFKGTGKVRALIAAEYAKTLMGIGTVMGLAVAAGGKVGTDRNSADYGKVIIGKNHIDFWAGLLQARRYLNDTFFANDKLGPNRKFGQKGWWGAQGKFFQSKLAPSLESAASLMAGEDVVGRPMKWRNVPEHLFAPISWPDMYQIMKEEGLSAGEIINLINMLGVSVQNYDSKSKMWDKTLTENIMSDVFGKNYDMREKEYKKSR